MAVPFFRPALDDATIVEVVETLKSGWLTTGPRCRRFEAQFAEAVGARHAVALNSATAALHLATVALGLRRGDVVLVPTMTFAATGEIVRYADATPLLVDCDAETLNVDLDDAERQIARLRAGELPGVKADAPVVGILPVHVGGSMIDMDQLAAFADRHDLWVVEDAAHAFPAAYRRADGSWKRAGEGTAAVTCFSFYANKTITTGEGGMAVTDDAELAAQVRSLSLHGLSSDAWGRYRAKGSWDYRILAPGYKYNLTDIAAAIGLHQLAAADELCAARARVAAAYGERLAGLHGLRLPCERDDRRHSWHLYQVFLEADTPVGRDELIQLLGEREIGTSVHWRPLHLHPYYSETYGWRADDLPRASEVWRRSVSLPIFPDQREDEIDEVCRAFEEILDGRG